MVPTPTSIGLRFVFPFEHLHCLHYGSMIGPALVYPRVPREPWTYEPHAHHRTVSSAFSPLVLVLLLSSILVCLVLLHLPWYLFSLRFRFVHFLSALVLTPSAFPSVNVCFCRFSLRPSFSDPSLNTRCGVIYSLISLFRIAASSTPFFWSFGMNFVIIRRPPCGLHIRLSRVG